MHVERLKNLLEFLKELPEEKFDYDVFCEYRSCGTVGCVAGWCTLQNGLGGTTQHVQTFLGLSKSEAYFLFFFLCDFAKKSDAIKRLEWLIENGATRGYPVYKESWNLAENLLWVKSRNEYYELGMDLGEFSDEHRTSEEFTGVSERAS